MELLQREWAQPVGGMRVPPLLLGSRVTLPIHLHDSWAPDGQAQPWVVIAQTCGLHVALQTFGTETKAMLHRLQDSNLTVLLKNWSPSPEPWRFYQMSLPLGLH